MPSTSAVCARLRTTMWIAHSAPRLSKQCRRAWPPRLPRLRRHNGLITWTYYSHAEILDPAVGRHCVRATIYDIHPRRRGPSRDPGIADELVDRATAEGHDFRQQPLFQQR